MSLTVVGDITGAELLKVVESLRPLS
jgi:hypothetical protein